MHCRVFRKFLNFTQQMHTYICSFNIISDTYDHRLKRIGHPVRSAIHKLQIGRLVVGWVTTSESLLLYVLFSLFFGGLVTGKSRFRFVYRCLFFSRCMMGFGNVALCVFVFCLSVE